MSMSSSDSSALENFFSSLQKPVRDYSAKSIDIDHPHHSDPISSDSQSIYGISSADSRSHPHLASSTAPTTRGNSPPPASSPIPLISVRPATSDSFSGRFSKPVSAKGGNSPSSASSHATLEKKPQLNGHVSSELTDKNYWHQHILPYSEEIDMAAQEDYFLNRPPLDNDSFCSPTPSHMEKEPASSPSPPTDSQSNSPPITLSYLASTELQDQPLVEVPPTNSYDGDLTPSASPGLVASCSNPVDGTEMREESEKKSSVSETERQTRIGPVSPCSSKSNGKRGAPEAADFDEGGSGATAKGLGIIRVSTESEWETFEAFHEMAVETFKEDEGHLCLNGEAGRIEKQLFSRVPQTAAAAPSSSAIGDGMASFSLRCSDDDYGNSEVPTVVNYGAAGEAKDGMQQQKEGHDNGDQFVEDEEQANPKIDLHSNDQDAEPTADLVRKPHTTGEATSSQGRNAATVGGIGDARKDEDVFSAGSRAPVDQKKPISVAHMKAFREAFVGFVGIQAVFTFTNFVFSNVSAGILCLLAFICAVFTHSDRRAGTYALNGLLSVALAITISIAVGTTVEGFETYYTNDILKAISIGHIPLCFAFAFLSLYLAWLTRNTRESSASSCSPLLPHSICEDRLDDFRRGCSQLTRSSTARMGAGMSLNGEEGHISAWARGGREEDDELHAPPHPVLAVTAPRHSLVCPPQGYSDYPLMHRHSGVPMTMPGYHLQRMNTAANTPLVCGGPGGGASAHNRHSFFMKEDVMKAQNNEGGRRAGKAMPFSGSADTLPNSTPSGESVYAMSSEK